MRPMNRERLRCAFASLSAMAPRPDNLHAQLPQDVLSDLGGWTRYQRYRPFTWPWLIRRGYVFWPLALLAGGAFAAWHASGMDAWGDWPGLAWRASLASLVTASTGPALATGVRYMHLRRWLERALVLLSILLGLWIGYVALAWVAAYHAHLMQAFVGRTMSVSFLGHAMSRFFGATVNASTFALVFAGGGLAVIYYLGEQRRIDQYAASRQLQDMRAQRDAADQRLAVLQAQVEPHFLFNTLASVRSLIAEEPERAARTIDALATYLRATLPRLRTDGVEDATLGRQLDLCRDYLELMNIRMAGRIRIRIDAEQGVRALPFPPLILLTLVENAITHGVEPRPGPCSVAIKAAVADAMLMVVIEDDGAGLSPGITPGLGLANVRAQLKGRFGDRASLEVLSRPEGGVRASIRMPVESR
jgi:two-component sensor histidine kinase